MTDTFTSDSGVKYDIVWNWTVNKITWDWFEKTVTNIPIYVLQKSSQSREVQEESTSPTESEKKDFWKKLMQYVTSNMICSDYYSLENFLSSNWYL